MNDKKSRFLVSCLIFLTGLIVNIYFSEALNLILSRRVKMLRFVPITECILSIVSQKQHTLLFLCLQGFIILLAFLYYFTNSKPYQSELKEITPQIRTPVPAGQKQHGSAKWLSDKEKEKAFDTAVLDLEDKYIKKLMTDGSSDIHKGNEFILKGDDGSCEKVKDDLDILKSEKPEKSEGFIQKGGVIIGLKKESYKEKIYFIGDDVHTLCIGATRSGKSRTVVLQSICTLALAAESIVVSDPKGELWAYTAQFLERLGYEVITIDFKNPLKSQRYNFLQR